MSERTQGGGEPTGDAEPRPLDVTDLVDRAARALEAHRVGPGAWRRHRPDPDGQGGGDGPDPYGCADAANLLYTLGRMPRDPAERAASVETLCALQDPHDGLYHEPTHHPIHTTAHCVAALELFDAAPRHPLHGLRAWTEPDAMERFLEALDWRGSPWLEAHRGAGLYAALVLAGDPPVDAAWRERYLAWVAAEVDPATGLLRRGCVPPLDARGHEVFGHLAGSFHYFFDLDAARRPLPHAAALVDTALALRARGLFPLARFVGFAEIDWVWCLARATQQSGHRHREARAALIAFAAEYVAFLRALDWERDPHARDLHALFGAFCALAELQRAVPGLVRCHPALRLVLDRRPFL